METYIQAIGNKDNLRAFVVEELFCPGDSLEADGIQTLLDRAAALDWPELQLPDWDAIAQGREHWEAFARYLSEP